MNKFFATECILVLVFSILFGRIEYTIGQLVETVCPIVYFKVMANAWEVALRKLSVLLVVVMLFAACAVNPVSAADAKAGFYNIGTADGVTITAAASSGSVTEVNEDVDGDKTVDKLYNGSDKLTVTYSNATAEKWYIVWLVEGAALPKSDAEKSVHYVEQVTASGTSVVFTVLPSIPKETMQMTLFITSNDGKPAVSVPVSYLAASAASDYKVGDVNADGKVNANDRRILSRYLAKWSGAEEQIVSWEAADINKDGKVNANDRRILSRYLAKWGGENDKYFQ